MCLVDVFGRCVCADIIPDEVLVQEYRVDKNDVTESFWPTNQTVCGELWHSFTITKTIILMTVQYSLQFQWQLIQT